MRKENARILVIDDDEDVVFTSRMLLKDYFANVDTLPNPKSLESLLKSHHYDVIVLDMNFKAGVTTGNEGIFWLNRIRAISPNTQVVLQTAYGDIELAVRSIKEGAVDFLPKPWDKEKLLSTLTTATKLALSRRADERRMHAQHRPSQVPLIGASPAMQSVIHAIEQVSSSDANVLILGENGTGKELVASAIHAQSRRCNAPFVTVDLGAVPESLFESEMFGHEKGAFTDGKEARIGKFELANGGTLFLDEVGNLPVGLQVKLLSVLQTRKVSRIGSNFPVDLDVRVICATNAPVYELVKAGLLRQDLFYRIRTVEILVPPLRDRKEDIPLLLDCFLTEFRTQYSKDIVAATDLAASLSAYHWPGNVRELRHAVERAVILSRGAELSISDFHLHAEKRESLENATLNLAEMEKDLIRRAIKQFNGNLTRAAEELGIGRSTLYRKIEEYGIVA